LLGKHRKIFAKEIEVMDFVFVSFFFLKKKKKKKPLFCYTCAGGIGGGVFHGFFFAER
jgi:hypothetical protein